MDAQTRVVSSNFAAINLSKSLLRELNLLWQFTGRDISSTIIPPILFIVAAWHYAQSSFSEFLFALPCGTLFVWLYLFSFGQFLITIDSALQVILGCTFTPAGCDII